MLDAFDGPLRKLVRSRRTFKRRRALRSGEGGDERGAWVMSAIPLHLQRKFEKRWAARFAAPVASAARKITDLKGTVNDLPRRAKAREIPLSKRA